MKKDAISIALHFLKFRPRSVFEIREKLRSKKYAFRFSEKEVDATIKVLKANKLLDDKNFAKMYVRDRNLLKPTGSYLLKLELKRLGLSDQDIETALQDQDDEELAKKALESKTRYCHADFQKQAAFLKRRGFSTTIIYSILKK